MTSPRPVESTATPPAAAEAGTPARCPRCRTVVAGDYKFCPACAYRLRVSLDDEPAPPPSRSGWKLFLFSALGGIVALGCAALGYLLFAPNALEPVATPRANAATSRSMLSELRPAKTVADIATDLVELDTGGVAAVYSVEALPVDEATRARIVTALDGGDRIRAIVWSSPRFLRYEVTNGQYAEFVDDILAHPDRVPDFWRQVEKVPRVQDVDVMNHVPRPWIQVDAAGDRTWRLDDDARNLPVTHVSFVDAQGFAEWAGKRLGLSLRLPLVMEWMRAARSGKEDYLWPWGKEALVYACNNAGFGIGRPVPVQLAYSDGSGGATLEGLFAMAGNVAEWTFDHDVEVRFPPSPGEPYLTWKPKPPGVETLYYACGGSFRSGIDDCQAESRERVFGTNSLRDDIGFRLVAER